MRNERVARLIRISPEQGRKDCDAEAASQLSNEIVETRRLRHSLSIDGRQRHGRQGYEDARESDPLQHLRNEDFSLAREETEPAHLQASKPAQTQAKGDHDAWRYLVVNRPDDRNR